MNLAKSSLDDSHATDAEVRADGGALSGAEAGAHNHIPLKPKPQKPNATKLDRSYHARRIILIFRD